MPRQLRPRSAPIAKAKASAPAEWLHLDRQLCFALYSSSLAMTKLYRPLLEPLGLTYPQYLALLVLWERDGLGVNELSERLFLDSGTLTPLLKRMEAAGWVQRERDRADERRVVVSLTADGRALRKQAQNVPPQVARASGCSAPELAELTLRLQRLRDQLLASSSNPSPTDAAPPASAH